MKRKSIKPLMNDSNMMAFRFYTLEDGIRLFWFWERGQLRRALQRHKPDLFKRIK